MTIGATSVTTNPARSKWSLISAILIILLTVEIYFLLRDKPGTGSAGASTAPIAELVRGRNEVRVQAPGDLVWEKSKDGQALFRRQSLLTAENSLAEIAFLDGTGLLVSENSLIQIERRPSDDAGGSRMVITLLRGSIHGRRAVGKGGTPFEINVGNAVATVPHDAELTVTAGPEGATASRLQIHKGEIGITSPGGQIRVRAGEEATVGRSPDSTSPASARKAVFALLAPRPGESFVSPEGKEVRVRFQWTVDQRQAQESPLEIEASPDPEFGSGVRKALIGSTHPPLEKVQVSLSLPPAERTTPWYWRVRALNNRSISRTESFVLRPEPRPVPVYPLPDMRARPGSMIEFLWDGVADAALYELEIQPRSPEARAIARRSADEETHIGVESLKAGSYAWRVRALGKRGEKGGWSASRELVITSDAGVPPPPDGLDSKIEPEAPKPQPKPRHSFWRSLLNGLLADAWAEENASPYSVWLHWRAVPGVSTYRIQIAKDRRFQEVITESDTDAPNWVWFYEAGMENSQGRVFYRVASVNRKGEVGRYSKPKPVPLSRETPKATAAPVLAKPAPKAEEQPKLKLIDSSWRLKLSLHTGLGGLQQSSGEADLVSVKVTGAFLQNKVALGALWTRKYSDESSSAWRARAQVWLASYSRPELPRTTSQERVTPVRARLEIIRESSSSSRSESAWRTSWGGLLDRSFRWVKNGRQTVEPQSTFSLGPELLLMRELGSGALALPRELGATIAMPLTGAVTSGQFGIQSGAWLEWRVPGVMGGKLGALLEGELDYLRWSKPRSTGTFAWTLWLAPSLHF